MKNFDKRALNKIVIWLCAVRSYSFTASIIPCLLAACLALYYHCASNWMLLPLIIICSVFLHAGTNLANDCFDFKKRVDQNYEFVSSRTLIEGKLKPKEVLTGALIFFILAFILGLILVAQRGPVLLLLGILGIIGGYFYSASPLGYKYLGLGDILVFLLMGPLMVCGAYFALTAAFDFRVFFVSLPIGFLVTSILNSNNIRDILHDRQTGIRTFAGVIGYENAKKVYFILIISSYLSASLLTMFKILPLWTIAVFLSLPIALKNMALINTGRPENAKHLAMIDVYTAKLHLTFGSLLIISILLGSFTNS